MDPIECFRMKGGNKLSICYDTDPCNPFTECDHEGINLYWCHRNYAIADEGYNFRDRESLLCAIVRDLVPEGVPGSQFIDSCLRWGFDREETDRLLTLADRYAYILPVYAYEHGGITISTGSFSDSWDSGQCGFIAVRKADFTKDYLSKADRRLPAADRSKKAEKYLNALIKEIDNYLTCQVYGFKIETQSGEPVDSCWGFNGSDHEKSGLLDAIGLSEDEYKRLDPWTGPDPYPDPEAEAEAEDE